MARFFACAGVGVFLTLAASVLAIFAHISQINGNIVPRNFRMVTVETSGLGDATGAGSALYGSGPHDGSAANTGVRQFYEWGLWNYCSKDSKGGSPDYCDSTTWAHEWRPVPAILVDVPSAYQSQVANVLPSGVFTSDDYLGRFSKGAFYVLFVGAVAGGLAFLTGFLAHRFAFLLSALFAIFGFLCEAVGCIIWIVLIARARSSINGANIGIHIGYGVSLWLYFASAGCLLFSILPFILGCIAGRDRY